MRCFLLAVLSGLRLLTFDVDATPPVGSELTYQRMAASSPFSLRARGIVLYGAGNPVVLCAVDWIGISNESQDVFKAALAEAAGTIPERVEVHTVHQHDAPICDFSAERILAEKGIPAGQFDGSFAREVIVRLQQAVRDTAGRVQPVTAVGTGKAKVRRVASNRTVQLKDGSFATRYSSEPNRPQFRRMAEGLTDPELSMVSFWNGDEPLAALTFYATHPQSYYLTGVANPDFPGIARALMDLEYPDVLHVHFNGAGGNIAAGKYNDGSHRMRRILAERLKRGMETAWRHTRRQKIRDLNWQSLPLDLPASAEVAGLEDSLSLFSRNVLSNSAGRLGWYRRSRKGPAVSAACLTINDDISLLFLPGELFVEYQLAAKRMAPDRFVALAAYGDYGPFYIGTKMAYEQGGYEIRSSPVTKDAETTILQCIATLLDHQ